MNGCLFILLFFYIFSWVTVMGLRVWGGNFWGFPLVGNITSNGYTIFKVHFGVWYINIYAHRPSSLLSEVLKYCQLEGTVPVSLLQNLIILAECEWLFKFRQWVRSKMIRARVVHHILRIAAPYPCKAQDQIFKDYLLGAFVCRLIRMYFWLFLSFSGMFWYTYIH